MSLETNCLYEFGNFRLDAKNKILMGGGEPVALRPKVFELLTFFVQNPERLIEKDELMQKMWAESFVEESNLTFNIRQLRKALNDNAQNPIYIRTVPRHGYRFIAEVKKLNADSSQENTPAKSPVIDKPIDKNSDFLKKPSGFRNLPKPLRSPLPLIGLLILLITSLAATASWVWRNYSARPEAAAPILNAAFKSEKLTNTGGVYQAVISPDGKRMAYSSEINRRQSLWIRQFEPAENKQILPESDDFYYGLEFSHDGQTLFFARGRDTGQISIYRVSNLGGIPSRIAAGTEGWFSLSPDDRQISFVRCDPSKDDDFCALFVADADGKNERKLLTRPRPVRIADNQFAPDGKSIAFAVGQSDNASNEFSLKEIDLETGAERELTPQKFFNVRHLRWLPDKSGLLITATERLPEPAKIYQVSRQTGEVKTMSKDSNHYNQISLDNRAEKLVVTQFVNDFRLWLAPAGDLSAAQIITYAQSGFVYTPGGKIIYGSTTDGNQNIWMMNGDGSGQRQLTNGQGANWQPRVSPDERFIYFASNRSGSGQVWRMNPDGSNQTQISNDEGGEPIFVAPDGNSVYYASSLTNILKKITIDKDGGFATSSVSGERMFAPDISATGETVAYFSRRSAEAFQIVLLSVADGKPLRSFPLAEEKAYPLKIVWAKDTRSLYYSTKNGSKNVVWKLSTESGKSEMLTEMHDHDVSDFAFSPNGETFAFICGRWKHDAYLMEGLK